MNFIKQYLLPKEIDFNAALKKQINASKQSILDLCQYCQHNNLDAFNKIRTDGYHSRELRRDNMRELLNVFITPYDKEGIYRMITQLDWIVLSVKHLVIDIEAYQITCPNDYHPIFEILTQMILALEKAFHHLPKKELNAILKQVELVHDAYDEAIKLCAIASLKHLEEDEIKRYLSHKEILNQFKAVAQRIHISANYLEDMAMKIV